MLFFRFRGFSVTRISRDATQHSIDGVPWRTEQFNPTSLHRTPPYPEVCNKSFVQRFVALEINGGTSSERQGCDERVQAVEHVDKNRGKAQRKSFRSSLFVPKPRLPSPELANTHNGFFLRLFLFSFFATRLFNDPFTMRFTVLAFATAAALVSAAPLEIAETVAAVVAVRQISGFIADLSN